MIAVSRMKNKYIKIFILATFFLIFQMAHAEQSQGSVVAGVVDGQITITFSGQIAKDIYNNIPENNKVLPTKKCRLPPQSDRIIKVKGGFVCGFSPGAKSLDLAYGCTLDVSVKTGKTLEIKPRSICYSDDQ